MKKCLFLGAVAAMLLGTASCSSDMEPAMDGEVPVSFAIDLGDGVDSRTISDGTGADQLKFAVFENGAEITGLAQTVEVANKQATINTKLVKGHTYTFVFWAQNSACTAYNTADMSAIKVDYAANCNDETRDAFYKMDSFTVTEAFEKTEVLTRPFAQINFLADDAAGVVGVDAYKSKVTVTGVPTTLNTLDGTVGTETTDVTFALDTIPNETLAGYETYKYVAMNYILAATSKEMKNEVVLTVNDGTQDVNTVTVTNCPVQRNYRTNIFGSLFTVDGKFNIEIDPIYAGEFILPEVTNEVTSTNGQKYSTPSEAILADKAAGIQDIVLTLSKGTYTDVLCNNNLGTFNSLTIKAADGVDPADVIIDGQCFFSSRNVTMKGITLTNANAPGLAAIEDQYGGNGGGFQTQKSLVLIWTSGTYNFENCIFNNVSPDATGIYTYWLTEQTTVNVKNCVFNGGGTYQRAIQIYGETTSTIENCTFTDIYRYAACIHGGSNIINWIDNTVLEEGLNPSKKCFAIEHGSRSYARGADDPQDQIYVKGGNYPETGDKFVPYTIAYDEQPILTGTMPDGSAAIWQ